MKNYKGQINNIFKITVIVIFVFFINNAFAQPALPSREITVFPTQPIDFGTFYINGAGTIEVDYQGNVTTTGGVISLNTTTVTPAIFDITLCQGRTVTITYPTSVMIDGSNGGQLELVIGPSDKGGYGAVFPVNNNCNFITQLRVGGKLNVPALTVPGIYSGIFPMTFTQE